MGDGGGTALEFLTDAPQLSDELPGLADGEVGLGDLSHGCLQLLGNIHAAVFAEIAVLIGIILKIGIKIHSIEDHNRIPPNKYIRCRSDEKQNAPDRTFLLSRTNKSFIRGATLHSWKIPMPFCGIPAYPRQLTYAPTLQNTL